MLSHELGFSTSWKMLTRDKGWIKPLLVLTLVSWIPILGQIAVLGYGLEWARLTAWGVDSAPKQRDVKYGKVLVSGGIAFLVAFTMSLALSLLNLLLFGGAYVGAAFPLLTGATVAGMVNTFGASMLWGGASAIPIVLMIVVNVFFGTFISAAMMRATLYDDFAAGWRVDRLLQMVGRDIGGFFHTYAVSLIGGIISWVVAGLVAVLGALTLGIGVFSVLYGMPQDGYSYDLGYALLHMGAFPILVLVLLAIVLLFAVQVVSVAMQLIAINAVGQWFNRFDVNRWGVSSAPLPDDVPYDAGQKNGSVPAPPSQPVDVVSHAVACQPAAVAPEAPIQEEPSCAPVTDDTHTHQNPSEDTPELAAPSEPVTNSPESEAPEAEKKPIPLGPITEEGSDQKGEDGPIQA